MDERILFLTGRLAQDSLRRELDALEARHFSWRMHEPGSQVAGLMTTDMIGRRLPGPDDVDRVIVPGLCSGDLRALSETYGILVERGPKDLQISAARTRPRTEAMNPWVDLRPPP